MSQSQYSQLLHQDFLTRSYLNIIYEKVLRTDNSSVGLSGYGTKSTFFPFVKQLLSLTIGLHNIKKRINLVNRYIWNTSPFFALYFSGSQPTLNISCATRTWRKVPQRGISYVQDTGLSLATVRNIIKSYWIKYKLGLHHYLGKKNLFYICSITSQEVSEGNPICKSYIALSAWFEMLRHTNKYHHKYRCLILNTVIKSLSSIVYHKMDRVLCPSNLSFRRPNKGYIQKNEQSFQTSYAGSSNLLYLQLNLEYLDVVLYYYTLPFTLVYFIFPSYYSFTKFGPTGPNLDRRRKMIASSSHSGFLQNIASSLRLSQKSNDLDVNIDTQLPKFRKPSYISLWRLVLGSRTFRTSHDKVSLTPYMLLSTRGAYIQHLELYDFFLSSKLRTGTHSPIFRTSLDLEPFGLRAFNPHIYKNIKLCWNQKQSPWIAGGNVPDPFRLGLVVRLHNTKTYNASSFIHNFSRFIIAYLKKNQQNKNKLQQLKNVAGGVFKFLSFFNINGAFQYSGRIYGAKKAASFKILVGSVPLNTLDALIDYDSIMQKTKNGTWGFKVWLCHEKLGNSPSTGTYNLNSSPLQKA